MDWDAVATVQHSPHSLQANARAVKHNANMGDNVDHQSDDDDYHSHFESSSSRSVDISWALLNPLKTLAILVRTRALRLLTLACALNSIAGNGADVVETSFANSQFNFTPAQLATLNIVGGAATIIVQVGIVPLLLRVIASPLRVAQFAAMVALGACMLQALSWNELSFDAGSGARSFGSLVLPIRACICLCSQTA
jgi:hypothetical protein